MGEIVMRKIRRMNWKSKIAIFVVFTMLFSIFAYEGFFSPRESRSAITMSAWTTIYNNTNYPSSSTFAYTVPAGTNRMLVVVASSMTSAAATQTYTISYGGQALTEAVSDRTTSSQQHSGIWYLKEAGIGAGNGSFSITITGGTSLGNLLYVTTLAGVDQTAAINTTATYNSGTNTTITPTWASALVEDASDQPIAIINTVRMSKSQPASITAATNWSIPATGNPGNLTISNTNAMRAGALTRTIPGTNTSDTTAGSPTLATNISMSGISVPAAIPPTVTSPTSTSITGTTATLGANITSAGSSSLTARGTCWNNSSPVGSNNCVAEGGTGTGAFTQARTGLPPQTRVYYTGYGTSGAGTGYSPEGSFYTEPQTQASNVTFTGVGQTGMTVNWTRGSGGSGGGVLVLMKAASAVTGTPADGTYTGYTANTAYGSGTLVGNGYVVYKGTGTSVLVTGLTGSTTYYVAVFEFAGQADNSGVNFGTNYNLTPATGSQATTAAPVPPTVVSGPTLSASAPYSVTGSYVPGSFHVNTVFNDNAWPISTCEYNTGSGWTAATKSGSGATTNCDADVTATNGAALSIQMRATSGGGQTATSTASRTCDAAAPAMSGNTSYYLPADGAIEQPRDTVQMQVTGGITDASGAVAYQFQVDGITDSSYHSDSGWIANNYYHPAGLVYGYTYQWRVRAKDAVGNYSDSAWYGNPNFTVAPVCQRSKPTMTLKQGTLTSTTITTEAGSEVYTLTIKNNDDGGCGDTTFNLSALQTDYCLPNYGWACFAAASLAQNSVTLSPTGLSSPPNPNQAAISLTVTALSAITNGRAQQSVTWAGDANHGSTPVTTNIVTTNISVAKCFSNTPQIAIGPDADYVNINGSIAYTVSIKNADTGTCPSAVTFTPSIVSETNAGGLSSDFNTSSLSPSSLSLNAGQTGTVTLTVTSKSGATVGHSNITTLGLSASGHTSPANVTATTTVGNPLLHNSVITGSTKWAGNGGWGLPATKYGEIICTTCHIPGGSDTNNVKRVHDTVTAPNGTDKLPGEGTPGQGETVVFQSMNDFGNDTGGHTSSTKVCEVCHSQTSYHRYNTSGQTVLTHNNNADCVSCHQHSKGFASAGACDSCHGAPPGTGTAEQAFATAYPTYAASHQKHYDTTTIPTVYSATGYLSTTTNYIFGCGGCHSTTEADHRADTDGIVNVNLSFGGTFTRGGTPVSHVRGSSTFYDYNSTCASTYCHGNFTGGTASNTPTWGTPSSGNCGTCHGATLASPPTGGSHGRHTGQAAGQLSLDCDVCHEGIATRAAISDKQKHVSGGTDWNLKRTDNKIGNLATYNSAETGTKTPPSSTYATCSNVYCHSNVQGSTGTGSPTSYGSPTWGGGAVTCATGATGCHDPMNTGGTGTGKHTKHAQTYNYSCSLCHNNAGSGTASHANYAINMSITGTLGLTTLAGTYGGGSAVTPGTTLNNNCSNVYCHSNALSGGSAVYQNPTSWLSTTPALNCSGCHNAPADATKNWSPAHTKHLVTYSSYTCQNCHSTTADNNTTINATTGYANHSNGSRNTGFNTFSNSAATYNGSTCANTYCHSLGIGGTTNSGDTRTVQANTSIAWNTTDTCYSCHGSLATSGGPDYPNNNATYQNKRNSHDSHKAYGCQTCHYTVTTTGTTITTPANHVNKIYNVVQQTGTTFTYTYNVAGGTCATTSCHGNATVVWGTTTPITCTTCHNAAINSPVAAAIPGGPAQRRAVSTEFGLAYGHKKSGRGAVAAADCIVCHLEGDFGTQKTSALHGDGYIDLRDPDGSGEAEIKKMDGTTVYRFVQFSTSYAAGTRYTDGQTRDNTDNILTQKFCLACHDSNGATNTTARSNNGGTGTAFMPFGGVNLGANYTVANGAAAAGGLIDAKSQFATTNSSFHPVMGPRNKDYPTPARLAAPYNNFTRTGSNGALSNGVVLNCFDCHNKSTTPLTTSTTAAHGNAEMIRGTIYVASPTLCTTCHIGTYDGSGTGAGHSTGSAFASVDAHMDSGGPTPTCSNCHASANSPARPIRAQDLHGNNVLPSGGTKQGRWAESTGRQVPIAFIRNVTNINNHQPRVVGGTTYTVGCNMVCRSTTGVSPYSPGGTY